MKKQDLEKLLMNPEGLKQIGERATGIKQKYGEGNMTTSILAKIKPTVYANAAFKPPQEIIQKNDLDNVKSKNIFSSMGSYSPELANLDNKKALSLMMNTCSKKPSLQNQILLEAAINRLFTASVSDAAQETLIDKAIKILSTAKSVDGELATDSIWTRVYQHSDYNGRSLYVNHSPGAVYRQVRYSAINSANLNDRISSLYVDASASEVAGEVYLFQDDRYRGRYAKFTTTAGAPSTRHYYPYVGDFINDRASSMLIVRRYSNELSPISLGSLGFQDQIVSFVNDVSNISLRGNPIITWDMWPEGPTSGSDPHPNEPSKRYIYARIPIEVDIPHWFDYDAEIRYWIYPYINADGQLIAYVDYYGAWVEGGVKHNAVLDRIMDELPDTVATVNTLLSDALALANAFGPFARQYFLPGTAANTGNTNDDITIVLVRS